MGKRLPSTPRSQVRAAMRRLWLRSRERATALKRSGYCCEECGVKQSRAKGREVAVEVHHLDENMDWEKLIDYVYRHLLCDPARLEVLCKGCHKKEHGAECSIEIT
jgi:5-methylcytosine-specific restriction endonuclease McrA